MSFQTHMWKFHYVESVKLQKWQKPLEKSHNSSVRVLSPRSSVIHGFVAEPWQSLLVLFSCERAASSVLEPRALLSACLVLCWSVLFVSCLGFVLSFGFVSGFGHSRSMFCLIVWACGSSSLGRALSCPRVLCVCVVLHAVRVFIGCVHSCYVLCCVARSLCFSLAACFHVVMSCVNTRLMSVLIGCVFVSCFAHGW